MSWKRKSRIFGPAEVCPANGSWGSGAYKAYSPDLAGDVQLNGLLVECKRRKGGTGFKSLYAWFEQDEADLLVVRADRMPRLYIIPEKLMEQFAEQMGWMSKEK